jgi:hypothetical protein
MPTFGASYPQFLQEAVDHADRLAQLLKSLDPRSARRAASTWLVGRVDEIECLVGVLLDEWRCGSVSAAEAAQSVNAYVNALHRGLAMNFGELAPACCVTSLVITATPASFLEVTARFPASMQWRDESSTWGEIDDAEILEVTSAPRSS